MCPTNAGGVLAVILELAVERRAAVAVFWLAAGMLLYVYAGYPLLLAVIGMFVGRRRPESGYCPRVSVLINACDDAAVIGKKICQTLTLEYPPDKLEVLVLSDCSTDRTDEIVRAFTDPRVRLVRIPERRGKTHAQNCGARHAQGAVLVFSDATSVYHSRALLYLASHYQDPNVGAVSGCYERFDHEDRTPENAEHPVFRRYENSIEAMQSRIGTMTGCCGSIYSVRRTAYTELPDDVISHQIQPLRVIQEGYKVLFEGRALAYEEATGPSAEEFAMRVRTVAQAMRGLLSVSGLLRPWKFGWAALHLWSHTILRWLVPLFLISLFAANLLLLDSDFYRLVLAAQLFFYAAAIVNILLPLERLWKPLGLALDFCTRNAEALAGMIALGRGREYAWWQSVRARR